VTFALTGFLVCFAAFDLPVGTELQFAGTLSQQTKSGTTDVKTFSLHTILLADDDGRRQFAFHLDERGGGSWGWPERFGLIPLPGETKTKTGTIRVLYSHEDQQYALPVRSPCFEFRDKLALSSTWMDGRREYSVTRPKKVNDRACFQVEVSSNLGKNQTLLVEAETGIVVSLEERVIIGRGDEFQLKMELRSQNMLETSEMAKSRKVLDSLLAIQTGLNRTGDQKNVELTSAQLNSLRMEFPQIEKEAEGTSWARFVAAIGRDLHLQQKRLDGVAGFQKKLVGQPAPQWALKLADGKQISEHDFEGQVVVLHFWQYRGEPLSEPYGQIGYLDFLYGKRKKLGVAVIGVNVDERFANPQQKPVALRSMKGLLDFMKIGYETAIDDGSVLAEFGDPRSTGAPLPLWIVIGHDGKVTHYHTGFYDIKPDEGLKPLDDAVVEAVRRKGKP
jgi:peroxiredoxin